MTTKTTGLSLSDILGLGRLAADAAHGVTGIVEHMHHSVLDFGAQGRRQCAGHARGLNVGTNHDSELGALVVRIGDHARDPEDIASIGAARRGDGDERHLAAVIDL